MSAQTLSIFAGAGSFFLGFLTNAFLELFKSKINDRTSRSERKREMVARLRITLGYMDAFCNHLTFMTSSTSNSTILDPAGMAAWNEMRAFDLTPIRNFVGDLTRLELEISARSGVGQSLVKRTLLFVSAAERLKQVEPEPIQICDGIETSVQEAGKPKMRWVERVALPTEARDAISRFQQCDVSLRRLISGPYAQRLGIDSLALTIDSDIMKWDRQMEEFDIETTTAKFRELWETFQATQSEKQA